MILAILKVKARNLRLLKNQKIILPLVVLLLAGLAFVSFQYMSVQQELRQTQAATAAQGVNEKVLAFTKLFIEKVLATETEVDFETRLQLENAVRAIGDDQILIQWKRFSESASEQEAQVEVKNLLSELIRKIER